MIPNNTLQNFFQAPLIHPFLETSTNVKGIHLESLTRCFDQLQNFIKDFINVGNF
jgi:hypothetical protein